MKTSYTTAAAMAKRKLLTGKIFPVKYFIPHHVSLGREAMMLRITINLTKKKPRLPEAYINLYQTQILILLS